MVHQNVSKSLRISQHIRALISPKVTSISYVISVTMMLVFILPARLSCQIVGATVSGTVMDSSGGATSGVSISIKNVATGSVLNTVSNPVGLYIAPNLLPGDYEITASIAGFTTLVRSGITLTVGEELVLNLTLQVGTVNQKIQVSGTAPMVDLANATLGGINNATTVEELPLNGRSWTDLAALEPGVHFVQNQPPINNKDRLTRGQGAQLSISGGRPEQNNYLMDGVNINDYANAGPGSLLGGNLGTDAVEEFSVLTTNYSTEYGRTSGGVISAITKSGTNQFHGDGYEFLRNSALDAANFFDNANNATKPPLRRNQYGGSAGGAIQKDKTFIFGDYEGVRQTLGTTTIDTVPSPAARAGHLSTGTVAVDPQAARFLNAFYPLPNGPISGDTGIFSFDNTQNTTENFAIVRADHIFSEKDRISLTYMFDNTSQSADDEFKNKLVDALTRRNFVALEENHIFTPALMNSFRAGFNRDYAGAPSGATAINPVASDPSFSFGLAPTAGEIDIGALTNFTGGLIGATPHIIAWNSWQAYDNLFYTKGIHSMKFGANVERIEQNSIGLSAPAGSFKFSSLSDFLTNNPHSFSSDNPAKESPRGIRQTIFGAYFQDDVRLRPNLTFNWGLRYEMATVYSEVQGKLSNLRVLNSAPPNPFLGSPFFQNPTKLNFEPRLGIAWDPFKDGKTAVRAGGGLFDILPLPVEGSPGIDNAFPFAQENSSSGALPTGSFPTGALVAVAGTNRFYIIQFNPKRNYIAQWNLNIQRQLSPTLTAMIGYVGSRGVHMYRNMDDVNIVLPTQTPAGLLWPCGGPIVNGICTNPGTGTRINTFYGRVSMADWGGDYFYDGLQVKIQKRLSHGLQIQGSYTWAKNIDTGSGGGSSDPYRNSITTLASFFCPKCTRGLSDTDIRHDLTLNYVWYVPTPTSFAAPAKAILGGWEVSGILTAESGTPFTVAITGDPLGWNSHDPWQFPNRIVAPGCTSDVNPGNPNQYIKVQCFAAPNPSTLFGNAGRNILIGPGLVDLDSSLIKNIPVKRVSETFIVQFRTEFFNILNRANFASPTSNNHIMDEFGNIVPFAGAITSTNTTSRQIQLALKLIW
jgi:hypothetical protein